MTRVAIDTNVLIYSELEAVTEKGRIAADLILRASRDGVVPMQVLGEYLRYVQRRMPEALPKAVDRVDQYQAIFGAPVTSSAVLAMAADWAVRHNVQFSDAVICAASLQAGASALLSEDMQDGRLLDGLRLINPFNPANTRLIEALLPS